MKLLNQFLELWREAKEKLMGNQKTDPKPNETEPQQPAEGTPAGEQPSKTEPSEQPGKPQQPGTDSSKS